MIYKDKQCLGGKNREGKSRETNSRQSCDSQI
jgi:hypothetical protein